MGCSNSVQIDQVSKKNDINITEKEKKRLELTTSTTPIRKLYTFEKVLGSGGFGIVKLGRMKLNEKKQVAIKIIEKSKLKSKQYLMLRELEVLKQLDHPNIIKFYEVYQDTMWFYIVMEYCGGGELMNSITKKKFFKEKEAARILHKLFSAVNHMHSKGIVHRDLKPENIMLTSNEPDSEIKIIDFGLSGKYDNQSQQKTMMGTPLYLAPEVLEGTSYDDSCDMWSLGVIMYMLLSGYPPFTGETSGQVFYKIQNAIYSLTTQDWQRVSDSAKDLIIQLIEKNPKKRLKSNQAFKHPWFQQVDRRISKIENTATIDPRIINMLKTYKTSSKFKTEVIKVFVNYLNEDEINEIKKAFQIIDKDKSGVIKLNQLQLVIENSGVKMEKDELVQIIRTITQDMENPNDELQIKYSEFIAATLDQRKYLTKEKLWGLFNYFDSSKGDYITQEDLIDMFARHGQVKTPEEVRQMIKEVDLNNDGQIQFEEFEALMKGDELIHSMNVID